MSPTTVADFEVSERAQSKMWDHGISVRQLYELIANRYVFTRNRKNRAADWLLIGRDDSGRCIVIPVLPTEDPYVWRPVTAWDCKRSEAAKLR